MSETPLQEKHILLLEENAELKKRVCFFMKITRFCYDCSQKWFKGYLGYEHPWYPWDKEEVLPKTSLCIECRILLVRNGMYWPLTNRV